LKAWSRLLFRYHRLKLQAWVRGQITYTVGNVALDLLRKANTSAWVNINWLDKSVKNIIELLKQVCASMRESGAGLVYVKIE
jgi:hypothetical protein